jgi:NitT/TauT family transport system substrate-binding protein
MNDALLSGRLDFASGGVAPMLTIWDKTKGNVDVKGVASLGSMPMYLNTNDPKVRSIKDFGEQDRIALPAVKVSIQAIVLRMAAVKAFGEADSSKLDAMTVSMRHPDAMAALLSNRTEITAHFGNSPFQELELQHANVHTVVNSYDVLGGPTTLDVLYGTEKFHRENRRVYNAVIAALREAMVIINADRLAAAKVYVEEERSKLDPGFIQRILSNADFVFTTTPRGIMRYADFMHGIDAIKNKPASWKDVFFEEIHDESGT